MNREILWLPSWYPNKIKPFDGDFIQRHAQAAALYNEIYVIKVVADDRGTITKKFKIEINRQRNLTEQIIYFKKSNSWFGRLISAFKKKGFYRKAIKKYIRESGKPDLVHVHVITRVSLLAIWLKRKFSIPFLISEHWTIYQPNSIGEFSKRSFLFKKVVKKIVKRSSASLTVSEDLGKQLQKLTGCKKYIVVSNVVSDDLFYYKPNSSEKFRFVHISTMGYQKNAEAIIENFVIVKKDFRNIELVLVGSASEKLFQIAENTGLLNKAIFFRGEIPYLRVAEELQQSNALVLFSRFENQPCVILEALCCGIPVISSSVGGIPEIIDSSNGILVDVKAKGSLSHAMSQMLKSYDSFDLQEISQLAQARFKYSAIGKKIDEIYSSY